VPLGACRPTYLGSYADRLWAQTALNPGVFLGLGPCTLITATGPRAFPVCSTNANLNERRVLSLQDPIKSAQIGALDLNSDVGWQKYRGLKLAARHRSANGVSLNGSYTCRSARARRPPTPSIRPAPATPIRATRISTPATAIRTAHTWVAQRGYQTPDVGNGIVHALASRLAAVGHPQRALGEPAQHHQRRRPRIQRHLGSAA
jgi:hypothetical protein